MTVRLMVVGLGRQGQRYLRIASSLDGVEVAATVDVRNRAEIEAAGGDLGDSGAAHFLTLDEALAGSGIDAAVVATTTDSHVENGLALLSAGIPTLIEKPLTVSESDASLLVELASAKKVLLATGQVERFNPAVQLVATMLQAGTIGSPISCSFRRVGLPPRSAAELGVVHDLAVHDIDVFSYLTAPHGPPVPGGASGPLPTLVGASGWPRTSGSEAAFVLLSSGDVSGLVEVNWKTPVRIRQFAMTTDTSVVQVNYTTQRVEVTEASDGINPLDFLAFQSHYSMARRVLFEPPSTEPLREQLAAFARSVEGNPDPVLASGEDGRLAVSIAEQACAMIAR